VVHDIHVLLGTYLVLKSGPAFIIIMYVFRLYSVVEGACNLVDIIEEHRNKYLDRDKDNTYRITVRRNEIWKDAIQSFKRSFNESKHLRFTFLGEPAVDDGGPKREFFMLFMNSLNSQESLFEGPLDKRVLRHNTSSLDKHVYMIVGKIIALSVIHGGPGPVFLAESVVNYIFRGGNPFNVHIEDFQMNVFRHC